MDEDDSKVKSGYYEDDKNQEELFEVLELDVDDMENVVVTNEDIEETIEEEHIHVKLEGNINRRTYSVEVNDTVDLSHYDVQNESEVDEQELFTTDSTGVDDIESPAAKRPRIEITLDYEPNDPASSTPLKVPEAADKSTAICEFEIFGNYVGAVMKNMKKTEARQLQMKIVQLINSHDEEESA